MIHQRDVVDLNSIYHFGWDMGWWLWQQWSSHRHTKNILRPNINAWHGIRIRLTRHRVLWKLNENSLQDWNIAKDSNCNSIITLDFYTTNSQLHMILERQLDLTQHPVIIVGIRFLGRQQFEQQKKVKYNIKIKAETCVSPKS